MTANGASGCAVSRRRSPASADFAIDKLAGAVCPNLEADFRCGIHARLRAEGFPGCTANDCFGAGQQVTQVTFQGQDWRGTPNLAAQVFEVFGVMRDLHVLLWYLGDALTLGPARSVHAGLQAALEEVQGLTRQSPDALVDLDRSASRRRVNALLLRASELVRGETPRQRNFTGRDLVGKDLHGMDLRGALLLGACLIGADLTGADLSGADLRGADLRGAHLGGADLSGCIFLIQAQVEAARGDLTTRLPASVTRPRYWSSPRC